MFKRILKIFGICMAIGLVVLGGGFGIFALRGGFKDVEINILRLYTDDPTKADSTVYTLEDFTTVINCDPLDATDKELDVIIQDPLRIEKNGKLEKEGVLKNIPKTVMAGEEFKIQINKDVNGNNYGGAVTLTFKPKNNEKAIGEYRLKIIVDVSIPDKSLYFAGNNGDTYSTIYGKTITMGISNQEQYVYLKSNLVNAFCLEADNQNLKKATISYVYKNLNGELVESKTFDDLEYDRIYNEVDKEYNYYFQVPVTPKESGTITMTAQMHRTYAIQKEYEENDFDNIEKPDEYHLDAQTKLDKYNEFINKYISYFDTKTVDDSSYQFFKKHMLSDGSIKLPYEAVEESKKYVFQTTTSVINISAVNLTGITSTDDPKEYPVFSSVSYTISDMVKKFDLDITLSEENVAQENKEKSNLFSTLQVSPYIYLSKDEYSATKDSLWQNYKMMLGVTGFTSDGKPEVDTVSDIDDVENDDYIGVLVALGGQSYKDYITSTLKNDASNKVWTLDFNAPLIQSNTESTIKKARRALFLQFQVSGRNLDTNEKIVCNAYSRIYITYTEYQYEDPNTAKITFADVSNSNEFKKMTINSDVSNASAQGYASKLNNQAISVDLEKSIKNYDAVQYKSVMYFVEQKSNELESGESKLATVGSYKFKYMMGNQEILKRFDSDEDLIGERLLNEGTAKNPNYVLRAVNASNEPARIFAVVYLSDVDGNPIDVNGRPITIKEGTSSGDEPTLVVFAITETSSTEMASVQIDNFVSNINYYTISQTNHSITEEVGSENNKENLTYSVSKGSFVKRNNIDSFTDPVTGASFSESKLAELQNFLKLKILSNNRFELYITNFELDDNGNVSDEDKTNLYMSLDVTDFYGKKIEGKTYDVNVYHNKQLALNNMATDFINEYTLNIQTTNESAIQKTTIERDDDGNVLWIKFEILAEGKKVSDDGYIYLMANSGVVNSLNSKKNDNVNWEVNKLEINDIWLANSDDKSYSENSYLKAYEKLYSVYSEEPSDKNQVFGNVTTVKNSVDVAFIEYYLYSFDSDDKIAKDSIRDNVNYYISSNLFTDGFVNSSENINLKVVDMSQAIADAEDSDDDNQLETFEYKDIRSYLKYYTRDTNNINISYLSASGVAQLQSDLYFPSIGDNIIVGSKQFKINDLGSNAYILAGGREYPVSSSPDSTSFGEYVVKISKGEYFPLVNSNTVLICDEEFVIKNLINGSGIISNIEDTASGMRREYKINTSAIVNGLAYNAKDYIDDQNSYQADSNSALEKKITNSGNVNSATIKFSKGGVLKNGNEEVFEQDKNGRYYLDTDGQYKIIDNDHLESTRYAKKGIVAYLMITFKFTGLGSSSITKAIAYELIQEPTVLIATGQIAGSDKTLGVTELKSNNSETYEYIKVTAGKEYRFDLDTADSVNSASEKNSVCIVGASYEHVFFRHCTFSIDSGNSAGIKFVINNTSNNEKTYSHQFALESKDSPELFILDIPHQYEKKNGNINIQYIDESGNSVVKVLRLSIEPDYSFGIVNGSGVTKNNDDKCYEMTVSAGDIINLDEKFTMNDGSLKFSIYEPDDASDKYYGVKSSNYASINGNELTIGESFAYGTNTSSTKDKIVLNISIMDNNTTIINVEYKLVITIKPTYIVNFENLASKDILYGTDIFNSNYIDIYGFNTKTNQYELLTGESFLTAINAMNMKLKVKDKDANGGVVTSDKPFENENGIKLTLSWNEGLTVDEGGLPKATETHDININVVGFEVYYSAEGEFKQATQYKNMSSDKKVTDENKTIEWIIYSDKTINVNEYFAVYSVNNILSNVVITPVLEKDSKYYSAVGFDSKTNSFLSGEYNLTLTMFNSSTATYIPLVKTNIKVIVKKLEFFYSEGGIIEERNYSDLSSNSNYALKDNITLLVSGDSFNINKYIKVFIDAKADNLTVLLEDSANALLSEVAVGESGVEYKLVYKIGDTKYYSGYTITIKKNVS